MTSERFTLDTNVLVYAADRRAGVRHERALAVLDRAARRPCTLTVQVLAEFFHATTRKGIVARTDAKAQLSDWGAVFPVAAADPDALWQALDLASNRRLNLWDALLLTTAARIGCGFVLSEDMQNEGQFGGVTVLNPFVGCDIPERVAELLR